MTVGCFGDVLFSVSEDVVKTISNFEWQVKAKYGVHDIHLGESLVEFTGVDAAPLKFTITLSEDLGVDPMTEIGALLKYVRNGRQAGLVLGGHAYGTGKWIMTEVVVKGTHGGGAGKLRTATVSVSMLPVGRR